MFEADILPPPQIPSLGQIRRILRAAMVSPDTRAYDHSLGFLHVLLPSTDQLKLRLHVWDTTADCHSPSIHNHAFSFASVVLRGAVEHQPFAVTEVKGACDGARQVYTVTQSAGATQLVSAGPLVLVTPSPPQKYEAGEGYVFPSRIFHTSRSIGESPAITFLAARKDSQATSCILSDGLQPVRMIQPKHWVSPHSLVEVLRDALVQIERLRASYHRKG